MHLKSKSSIRSKYKSNHTSTVLKSNLSNSKSKQRIHYYHPQANKQSVASRATVQEWIIPPSIIGLDQASPECPIIPIILEMLLIPHFQDPLTPHTLPISLIYSDITITIIIIIINRHPRPW